MPMIGPNREKMRSEELAAKNAVVDAVAAALRTLGYKPEIHKSGDQLFNPVNVLSLKGVDREPAFRVQIFDEHWKFPNRTIQDRIYVVVGDYPRKKIFRSKKSGGLDFKAIAEYYVERLNANVSHAKHFDKCQSNYKKKKKEAERLEELHGWDYNVNVYPVEKSTEDDYKLIIEIPTGEKLAAILSALDVAGLLPKREEDNG